MARPKRFELLTPRFVVLAMRQIAIGTVLLDFWENFVSDFAAARSGLIQRQSGTFSS